VIIFKQALNIVTSKNHLIQSGFLSILFIRSALNNGMSDRLKAYFPNIVPAIKLSTPILNINSNMSELKFWFAGFVSGEGYFFVKLSNSSTHWLGKSVALNFFVV